MCQRYIQTAFSKDDLLGLSAELLVNHGVLADNQAMRYETGMLEDIFAETLVQDRIFYQIFVLFCRKAPLIH